MTHLHRGEGRCCECDRVTENQDGDDWTCEDCYDDAIQAQNLDHELDDPRHGQAAELNRMR